MNASTIEYSRLRNGKWVSLFHTNVRDNTVVPEIGTIIEFPREDNDFIVTKVRFEIFEGNIVVEVSELYGTEA